MAFLPVESGRTEGMRELDVGGLENRYKVNPRPRYWVLKNQYTSRPVRREGKGDAVFVLVYVYGLDDIESTSTARFHAGSKSNIELNCIPILESHFYYIPEENHINGIQHGLSVRKACLPYLWTM